MKSKSIWCLFIVLILFNFIFVDYSYAEDEEDVDDEEITFTEEDYDNVMNEGQSSMGEIASSTSQAAGATGLFTSIGSFIIAPLSLISDLVNSGGLYRTESEYSAANVGWISIGSLVFDEYLMFNINLARTNESLNPDIERSSVAKAVDEIKNAVLGIYGVVNTICIVVFIVLAMYTFIRCFFSGNPTDKAKYKEMGNAWIRGLIFLFLALFIIMALNAILDWLMGILYNFRITMENAGYAGFENILFENTLNGATKYGGFTAFMYLIELTLFVVIDIMFFGKYFMRSLTIFLLTILAPIFAAMDVYNRLNRRDGKLNTWFNMYLSNVFIQPLHAIMYLIFMLVGANIVIYAPLAGILLLYALILAEGVGKVMLDFGRETLGSLLKSKGQKA